jgi:hypothetical protein
VSRRPRPASRTRSDPVPAGRSSLGELAVPRRHGDERRHTGTAPLGQVHVAKAVAGPLRRGGVGQRRDERRLVGDQRGHVVGVGRHERERGHRTAAAGEHLHRADPERSDHRVHVFGLDLGHVVQPVVLADTAAEPAWVVGDHGAVREVRREGAKPLASMGWPIMNSGGRPSAVGSGPRTSYAMSTSAVSSTCVIVMPVTTAPASQTHRARRESQALPAATREVSRTAGTYAQAALRTGSVVRLR